jgi:general secretion pathway protein G
LDGYLKQVPKDGWGREILYRVPGGQGKPYDLVSLGSDGREAGSGDAADLRYP